MPLPRIIPCERQTVSQRKGEVKCTRVISVHEWGERGAERGLPLEALPFLGTTIRVSIF
jgi:hypothetical protein